MNSRFYSFDENQFSTLSKNKKHENSESRRNDLKILLKLVVDSRYLE